MSDCGWKSRSAASRERVFDASVLYARSTANGWPNLMGI